MAHQMLAKSLKTLLETVLPEGDCAGAVPWLALPVRAVWFGVCAIVCSDM
jgi:hypothetical protein